MRFSKQSLIFLGGVLFLQILIAVVSWSSTLSKSRPYLRDSIATRFAGQPTLNPHESQSNQNEGGNSARQRHAADPEAIARAESDSKPMVQDTRDNAADLPPKERISSSGTPRLQWGSLRPEMIGAVYSIPELAQKRGLKAPDVFQLGTCSVFGGWFSEQDQHGILLGPAYHRVVGGRHVVWMAVVLHTRAAQECPFECHFYDDTEPPAFDLPVSQATCNRPISDHSGEHNSYFLSCDVPRATQEKPLFTQLSLKQNGQARLLGHPVSVQSGSGIQSSSERSGFGVCVKPTFKFFRAHQMVTFLEWYQHGGASHIFLYNHSWVHEVDDVIAQVPASSTPPN